MRQPPAPAPVTRTMSPMFGDDGSVIDICAASLLAM
jgi:hypothetical protein